MSSVWADAHRRHWTLWELKEQGVVSSLVWVLGTELGSSRAVCTYNR